MPLPQLRMYCTARFTSGPCALRAILMRSASDDSAPCAQQLPQYCPTHEVRLPFVSGASWCVVSYWALLRGSHA
jgi:hypothetical protein